MTEEFKKDPKKPDTNYVGRGVIITGGEVGSISASGGQIEVRDVRKGTVHRAEGTRGGGNIAQSHEQRSAESILPNLEQVRFEDDKDEIDKIIECFGKPEDAGPTIIRHLRKKYLILDSVSDKVLLDHIGEGYKRNAKSIAAGKFSGLLIAALKLVSKQSK